jgi:hypothetical protein
VDVSGVSGEGVVADGMMFDDPWSVDLPDGRQAKYSPGWCLVRWRGERASTSLWRSVDDLAAIHGHGGATRIVWSGRVQSLDGRELCESGRVAPPWDT